MGRTGTLVLAAVLGMAGGFAGSRIGREHSADHPTTAGLSRTVTVSSTAAIGSTPDEATISLQVSTDDADSGAAYAQNQSDAVAVVKALEADGVAKRDIKTTDINLYPHTVDRNTPNEHTIYTASETLTGVLHDLDTVGGTIADAIAAGSDRLQEVTFGVSDTALAREKALSSAVGGARAKADTLAQAAGSDVTGVVRIQEGNVRTSPYTYRNQAFGGLAASPATLDAAIVAPHQITTQVTVTVVWAIS
jgi:uncharacterized protein YggE